MPTSRHKEPASLTVAPAPERIVADKDICGGAARIRDTRTPVWVLEDLRRGGISDDHILRNYPHLSLADLEAAWEYVARHHDEIERNLTENE
jgi:uncharacterized protein (DUF433 family)